ncbi:unnamed protein product, partial [Closterium sp. NIES-54]
YAGYHAEFTDKYAVYLRLHCILDAQREEAERIFTEMDECEDEEEKERYKRRIYAMFHSRHKVPMHHVPQQTQGTHAPSPFVLSRLGSPSTLTRCCVALPSPQRLHQMKAVFALVQQELA